jgi:hypothetical protein
MRDYDYRYDVFDRNSEGWSAAEQSTLTHRSIEYVRRREVFNFNAMGETVFYRAVSDRKPIAHLQRLLDKGADESVRCGYGKATALSHAIACGTHDIVTFLLQTPNAPVSVGTRDGGTPLHQLGKMIRWSDGTSHLTTGGGCVMVYVEQLLSKGANPFIRDIDGYTPRDRFMQAEAEIRRSLRRDPTEAHAIINRLKMAEDGLVEDINNQRLMAVMMATQERIGADSPLSELDPDILRMIVKSMGALLTPDDIGEMDEGELRALHSG